ncbi:glycosyltransferase family 39 protein [Candidatus Woesearchaeota archaeon]|nr:glycosyltransferase family 39 protein [Candidatus Woesearchaeota archaeon]
MEFDTKNLTKIIRIISVIILISFISFKLFAMATSFHDLGWDESVYLGMGKYIYSQGTHGLWEEIRPPLLPLIIGLFWKLKLPYILLADIMITLFAVGTIILTYICAKEILKKEDFLELLSITPPLLLLSSELFLKQSYTIMTEIPAAFFILLTVYLYIKNKSPFLLGIIAALAFLTKYTAGFMMLSMGIILFFDNYDTRDINRLCRKLIYFISGAAIMVTPFLIINGFLYQDSAGSWLYATIYPVVKAIIHQDNIMYAVSNPISNLLFYPIVMVKENILFILGLLGAVFYFFHSKSYFINKQRSGYLISLSILLYVIYLTFIINKQSRFILLILPLLAIFSAYVLSNIVITKKENMFFFVLILVFMLVGYSSWLQITSNRYPFIKEKPDIINQYYHYPTNYNISSPLLTTDPHFTGYNDQLFIPMYNNVSDARDIYSQYKGQANGLIYDDEFYPCFTQSCDQLKQDLYKDIMSYFTVVYTRSQHPRREILISKNSVKYTNKKR